MRIVCGVLATFLLLFAFVQHDDPDGAQWMVIYGTASLWTALAAWRPELLRRRAVVVLALVTLAAAVGGMVHYWPREAEWWRVSVWWHAETAREGMGLMIVAASLAMAVATGMRRGRRDG